jgi:hypothetical protein
VTQSSAWALVSGETVHDLPAVRAPKPDLIKEATHFNTWAASESELELQLHHLTIPFSPRLAFLAFRFSPPFAVRPNS